MNSLLNFGFFFTCFLNSNHFGFFCLAVLLSILLLFVVGMFLTGAEIGSGLMMFSCADIPILNTWVLEITCNCSMLFLFLSGLTLLAFIT